MRYPKFCLPLVIAALIAILFAAPARSFADTYQLVGLGIDNTQFYGMDDAGHAVLYSLGNLNCGNPANGCYETFFNGKSPTTYGTPPAYTWDDTVGSCTTFQLSQGPCTISDNGYTAILENVQPYATSLFVQSGSDPLQLITTAIGLDGIFAINGSGDIIFDNANLDEWYEAVDLTTAPVPEPASIVLLATGILSLATILTLRRRRLALA